MTIHQYYDHREDRYYEIDAETYDDITRAIYDGLVASRINDYELVDDALNLLADAFNVKIEHKFNDELYVYHKGSVVNGTVYHGGNITSSIYHTGYIRN